MKKEITICNFCNEGGKHTPTDQVCSICGADCCSEHFNTLGVLVEGAGITPKGMRQTTRICPDCCKILTYDPCGEGHSEGRRVGPEGDRPNLRILSEEGLEVVMKKLCDIVRDCKRTMAI